MLLRELFFLDLSILCRTVRDMGKTSFKGQPSHTSGDLPKVGQSANFSQLVRNDLSEVSLETYKGKSKILSIFPSLDTGVCAASVRRFNKEAAQLKNTVVLNVSLDLPFANARFCGAEGISNCETLSAFRSSFGKDWGLKLLDSPLVGLLARAIVILSEDNKVLYTELIPEITQEPNYEAALQALSKSKAV
jgi:thiol peroxidase